MHPGLTCQEAVGILEYVGATIVTANDFVFATISLDATRCIQPQVDTSDGGFGGRSGDSFRRQLHLSYEEFERLRRFEMSPDEFRRIALEFILADS